MTTASYTIYGDVATRAVRVGITFPPMPSATLEELQALVKQLDDITLMMRGRKIDPQA